MNARWLLASALCAVSSIVSNAAEAPALQASVTAERIEVRNVSAGGEVVLFTAQLEATGGLLRQRTGATRVADTDGDAIVALVPPRRIATRSIWVAIDLESGRSVIAGPDGYTINVLPVPTTLLKKDAEGVIGVMDAERITAEMVIVRPKMGAWRIVASEGSGTDSDRSKNGKLSLASEDALPIGESGKAPRRLKKHDVIALIDPGRMEVFVTEIDQ
jgi:hypothetical protein